MTLDAYSEVKPDLFRPTAPIPPLAPVIKTVFPNRRDELKTDMIEVEKALDGLLSC